MFKQTTSHGLPSRPFCDVMALQNSAQITFPPEPLFRSAGVEIWHTQIMSGRVVVIRNSPKFKSNIGTFSVVLFFRPFIRNRRSNSLRGASDFLSRFTNLPIPVCFTDLLNLYRIIWSSRLNSLQVLYYRVRICYLIASKFWATERHCGTLHEVMERLAFDALART